MYHKIFDRFDEEEIITIDGKRYANVSDFFWWATSDLEEIISENLQLFIDAIDLAGTQDGPLLFSCWMRKMRPQGAFFKYLEKGNWWWFKECGPYRKAGIANPYPSPI